LLVALALSPVVLASPAAAAPCPAGLGEVRVAQLLFGRDISGRPAVSDAMWRAFVDREVTPRFPDGFTVFDGRGQWRGAEGPIVREPSKMLLVVLTGAAGESDRLAAIAHAYETRFHQQSVLLVEQSACATFAP
jgi:hypothetical protein